MNRRTAATAMLAGGIGASALAQGAPAMTHDAPEERIKAQVCVIGGGCGGIGAALAATRGGAHTVLLEREAILGGTMTMSWIHTWEPVSGADGIPRDLYQVMKQDPSAVTVADYAKGAPRRGGRSLPFEPRALVYAARELLQATGRCQVLVGTTFCHARVDGDRVTAVEAWFPGKRLVVEAEVFIDCTADGDHMLNAVGMIDGNAVLHDQYSQLMYEGYRRGHVCRTPCRATGHRRCPTPIVVACPERRGLCEDRRRKDRRGVRR